MAHKKDTQEIKTKDSKKDRINALTQKEGEATVEVMTTEPVKEDSEANALKASLLEKSKQIEEYRDKLLRTQAEFENYQKRAKKEADDFMAYANAQLVKDLLLILDDFQNAFTSCNEGADEGFKKGIELIYNNLLDILGKEGLCRIKTENVKFDPWQHEAVEMIPTKEHPENTVIGAIQPGYMFKDKILRPAKVRVTILPGEEREEKKNVEEHDSED